MNQVVETSLAANALQGPGMVRLLVLKDWYFLRWAILGYVLVGTLALALVGRGGEGPFYIGSILLITVLISVGIHLPMATIIEERKEQTLAFIMSLPISARDYTWAKLLANLLIFLVPWLILLGGTCFVILAQPALPDGLLPFAVVTLFEILASSCLILAVALIFESLAFTVVAIVFGNLFFQGFLYAVSHAPSIAAAMKTEDAAFNGAELMILSLELAATFLLLGLTFYFQSRKKEFL